MAFHVRYRAEAVVAKEVAGWMPETRCLRLRGEGAEVAGECGALGFTHVGVFWDSGAAVGANIEVKRIFELAAES